MDYWARNGHLMLHISRSGTDVTVYEASRSAGKVRVATYPKETFENEGFILRNPWHSGQCSDCTRNYNSTRHWDVCNVCGYQLNYSTHTQSNNYSSNISTHWKKCTGCSYIYMRIPEKIMFFCRLTHAIGVRFVCELPLPRRSTL